MPKVKTQSQAMKEMMKAMATMNKRMAQTQPNLPKPVKSKANPNPANPQVPMAMSPFPTSGNGIGVAICPRCGHNFRANKVLRDCPDCGLTVAEEDSEGELEWTENMKEPIPDFVYKSQAPEEIFYKSIRWYYDKWISQYKGNPSSRLK
jgi:hypothetical protein